MRYRSVLYVPASKERAVVKARSLPCDAVILDLEDAVAPDAKLQARQNAVRTIREGSFDRQQVLLRVNGLDTSWGRDDLAACADLDVAAFLLPKVSSPESLMTYRACIGKQRRIWAMIETCAAIINVGAITAISDEIGLDALVMGTNDLAKEMRCKPGAQRTPLLPALSTAVMAARAHGLVALDGVFNDIADSDGLQAECLQGSQLGFDGKTLIHPDQIAMANEMFSPSAEEIASARAIVDAFSDLANAGKGVITVGGKMMELLHLQDARRVLTLAGH